MVIEIIDLLKALEPHAIRPSLAVEVKVSGLVELIELIKALEPYAIRPSVNIKIIQTEL